MHIDLLRSNFKKINIQKSSLRSNIENIAENVDKKLSKISVNQNILNNALCEYFVDLQGTNEKKKDAENKIKILTNNIKEL